MELTIREAVRTFVQEFSDTHTGKPLWKDPITHNFDKKTLMSRWSHRHVARDPVQGKVSHRT